MSDTEGDIETVRHDIEYHLLRRDSETSDTSQVSSLAGSQRRVGGGHAPDAEDVGRKRRVYPKVRTGCDTCKKRKVKCDESKPVCRNCTKSGRACLGYHPPQAKLFDPLRRASRVDSASEATLFSYFISNACLQLAAFSQLQLNLTFWQQTVPSLSQECPPVRHAILAFAAILASLESPREHSASHRITEEKPYFALEQYTEVLEKLNSGISSATLSITATLVCCLLLTMCDLWHFGTSVSFKHVFGGLELCRIIKRTSPSKSPLPEASAVDAAIMIPAYQYLAGCATIALNHVTQEQSDLLQDFTTRLPAIMPPMSIDPADLYATAEEVLTRIAKLEAGATGATSKQLSQRLAQIRSGAKEAAEGEADNGQRRHLHLLRAHCTAASIAISAIADGTEQGHNGQDREFESVVVEMEALLSVKSRQSRLAMIAPLFLAATMCYDSALQQRALDALHGVGQREQYWTSCTAYQIGRHVAALKEQASFTDQRRICVTGIRFDPTQAQIELEYRVVPSTRPTSTKSILAWSPDEYGIHPVHKPEAFDMPKRVLQIGGYSALMLAYPLNACHCRSETFTSPERDI